MLFFIVHCLLVVSAWTKPIADPNPQSAANQERFSDVFFASIGEIVDHVITSRDLHRQVADYDELISKGIDPARNSRFRRQASFPSFPFGSPTGSNLGGGRPFGFSLFENMAQTVNRVDGMRCIPRSVCEMMANRGFSNSSFLGNILPVQAQTASSESSSSSPFSLSNPSTLRSVLGIMQMFRLNEMAGYPYVEAALWGTSHRDASRCRSQFSRCPESSTEGLITQLNSAPGGIQAVIANVTEGVRPQGSSTSGGLPVSAAVADTQQASGGFFDAFGNFFPLPSASQGTSAASASSSSTGAARPPTSAAVAEIPQIPGGFFNPFGSFFPFPQTSPGSSISTGARPPTNPVVAASLPTPGGFFDSSSVPVAFNPAGFPVAPFPPAPVFAAPPPGFDPFFQLPQPQFNPSPLPQVAAPPSNFLTRRRQVSAPSRQTNTNGDRWTW